MPVQPRSCRLLVMAIIAVCSPTAPAAEPPPRMNVLFIVSDDLNTRLNCYGYNDVRTPHLDRLAAEGMRFDRAYCQYPVCNPSRSSFLTGRRPETTGVLSNNTPLRSRVPDVITLPQLFRQNGYWTAGVNKIFHDREGDKAQSWMQYLRLSDERNPVIENARREFERAHGPVDRPENRDAWQKKRESIRELAAGQTPPGIGPTDMADDEQADGKSVRQIIQWLEDKAYGDKPFFIGCGIARPHIPYWAPQKYYDLYPLDAFKFAPGVPDDLGDVPALAMNPRRQFYAEPGPGDATRRRFTAAYYACVSYLDAQVGLLLDALKRLNLWDNTIVVFIGDHGYLLGEHGLWEKAMLFEESARAPLLMHVPGRTRPGGVCTQLVEFVDLYPTLAELCRIHPPLDLDGLSFSNLIPQPDRPWKRAAFTIMGRGPDTLGRSVRTQRWRYTEWGKPEVNELYDHEHDPHEFTNLAKDPAHAADVEELHTILNAGWRAALPSDARPPRSEAELRDWLENMLAHGFSEPEMSAATGLSAVALREGVRKLGLSAQRLPTRQKDEPLRVLPYPGGRHPRIGFLDGAIAPQRETKISVFAPWDPRSYVVVDVPEAIWWEYELLYLAHTHSPTIWTRQNMELEKLEWKRLADGTLESERRLPNGVSFGTKVMPAADAVRMELWLTNGADKPLTNLRTQICVMPKEAKGFEPLTNDNKVLSSPFAACRSPDGKRWVITAWEHCYKPWANPPCPCFHSDPKIPDCPPGQTQRIRGWLSFYEGGDIEAEFRRIAAAGWLRR